MPTGPGNLQKQGTWIVLAASLALSSGAVAAEPHAPSRRPAAAEAPLAELPADAPTVQCAAEETAGENGAHPAQFCPWKRKQGPTR